MTDPFALQRFLDAQQHAYDGALAELRAGRKRGHWIWFVFPQLAGLGTSPTSQLYGIGSLAEARAYLAEPVLGARLAECTAALLAASGTAVQILGGIDAVKVRSSMTLFLRADPPVAVFQQVLDRFYGGAADPVTDSLLAGG